MISYATTACNYCLIIVDEPSGKYLDFVAMFKDVQNRCVKDLFTEYRIYFGTARRRIVMMGIAVPCLQ